VSHTLVFFIIGLGAIVLLMKVLQSSTRRPGSKGLFLKQPQTKDQLTRVSQAAFAVQPLMNKGEFKAFSTIESYARRVLPGYRVFAQVSLGEILTCPDRDAYGAINAKRCDILIVNQLGTPALAIEYQGGGHYQQNAPMRDAVKKEALRQAGVPTIEIDPQDDKQAIEMKVALAMKIPAAETSSYANGSDRTVPKPGG
jgi:hypothetical protein